MYSFMYNETTEQHAVEVFMPYNRFLIEIPAMQRENALKTFGAHCVSAVEGQYICNMPLWDGGFKDRLGGSAATTVFKLTKLKQNTNMKQTVRSYYSFDENGNVRRSES